MSVKWNGKGSLSSFEVSHIIQKILALGRTPSRVFLYYSFLKEGRRRISQGSRARLGSLRSFFRIWGIYIQSTHPSTWSINVQKNSKELFSLSTSSFHCCNDNTLRMDTVTMSVPSFDGSLLAPCGIHSYFILSSSRRKQYIIYSFSFEIWILNWSCLMLFVSEHLVGRRGKESQVWVDFLCRSN
jgi:hypothetical protein